MPTNGTDNGNVRISQYHGAFTGSSNPANYSDSNAVVIIPAVEWDNEKNWWTVTFPVSGFSGFFITTGNSVLPLTLLDFKGVVEKNGIKLN